MSMHERLSMLGHQHISLETGHPVYWMLAFCLKDNASSAIEFYIHLYWTNIRNHYESKLWRHR